MLCAICPYWNTAYRYGRKNEMFLKFKIAISLQPLNKFLQNKDQIMLKCSFHGIHMKVQSKNFLTLN